MTVHYCGIMTQPRLKVSITFDPFMYLTLPLPVNKKWIGFVYYMPWDTTESILKVDRLHCIWFDALHLTFVAQRYP